MKYLFLLLLMASTAEARQWHLLEPTDVHVDMYKNENVHDPYLEPVDSELGYGANFNIDADLIKYGGLGLYWDNMLHFDQSERTGQVKHAGWEYELGLTVWAKGDTSKIDIFRQHHSRHVLEEPREQHFPVYDRYGIRFRIWP